MILPIIGYTILVIGRGDTAAGEFTFFPLTAADKIRIIRNALTPYGGVKVSTGVVRYGKRVAVPNRCKIGNLKE